MKIETILTIVGGSVAFGILAGFVTKSILVGIGLPIVLIVFGVMWLAIKPDMPKPPMEEEKKEDTTQEKRE